jgi:hypothetical protein
MATSSPAAGEAKIRGPFDSADSAQDDTKKSALSKVRSVLDLRRAECGAFLSQLDGAWGEYLFYFGYEGGGWGYSVGVAEEHYGFAAVFEAYVQVGH